MITLLISCFAAATLSAAEEEDLSATGCFASYGAEDEAEALRGCLETVVLTAQAQQFATSGNEVAARRLQKELEDRTPTARRLSQGAAGSIGTFYWDHMKKGVLEKELLGTVGNPDGETVPTQEWIAELLGDTAIDFCDRLLSHPEIELDCTAAPRLMLDGTHSTTVSFGAVDMVKAFGQLIMADFLTPGEVELFEPVYAVTSNMEIRDARKFWALDRMDGKMDGKFYQSEEQSGENVNIYIIDDGIQKDHKEFGGRVQEVPGWPSKFHGSHGTYCAGVAAGSTAGTAPKASIWSLNVGNPDGTMNTDKIPNAMRDAITHCKKSRRRCVVSMSIGWAEKGKPSAIIDKRSKEIWENGMLFVTAAGNMGWDARYSIMSYYENNIVVGASGMDDKLAFFSNYGDRVAIYAPGVNLLTSAILKPGGQWRPQLHAYEQKSGTSISTPLVAGILAGYLSEHPTMSGWEARKKLILDADRVPTLYLQREVACTVLADNHANVFAPGKYFHFDLDCVRRAIGPFDGKGREYDVEVSFVDADGTRRREKRHVIFWPRPNGGADGNAHGRIHPMSQAANFQWKTGLLFRLKVSQINSYFRPAKEGQRFWCDGTVVYGVDQMNALSPGDRYDGTCYQGCYTDDGSRDLRHRVSGDHDVKSCRAKCSERGFAYFGVQYGVECWCDNDFGSPSNRYKKVRSKECKRGGFAEGRGGAWRNSVYKTDCKEQGRGFISLEDMTHGDQWLTWKSNHHVDDVCNNKVRGDPARGRNKQCYCVRPFVAEGDARAFPTSPSRAGPLIVANRIYEGYDVVQLNSEYHHHERSCVKNHNIAKYENKTVDQCKALCDANPKCKAFEYGVAYGGSPHKPRDCLLQDDVYHADCDGKKYNLDLYMKGTRDFCGCHQGEGWCSQTSRCSEGCKTEWAETAACAHL